MLKLAVGVVERGYPVDLVLARAQGPYLENVPASIPVVNLNIPRDLLSVLPLAGYLRRERPATLFTGLHTNIIALWAKTLSRVHTRIVISERNTFSQRAEHYSSDFRGRMLPLLVRWFYPRADCIVAVSRGVADDLSHVANIPRKQIQVIYNPVVTPDLQAKAEDYLNHPWFRIGEPPVVLTVGRLTAQKDYPGLIVAFAQARKKHQARLLILGEGEERPSLERLVRNLGLENDVSMPGFVGNPFPYMKHAKVFVLSSKWEGLPGVLIEAMFCGVPLVSTDCPSGPKEILADGLYGRLVPPDDGNALFSAICDGLENKIPRPVPESWIPFHLDTVVDQYIQIFFK